MGSYHLKRGIGSVVGSLPTFPVGLVVLLTFTCQLFDHLLLAFGEVSHRVAKFVRLLQQRTNQLIDISEDMRSGKDSDSWVVLVHPGSTYFHPVSSVFACLHYVPSLMLLCIASKFSGVSPRIVNRG